MIKHPFTQDIRASQLLLITDGILENNRVINPGNPPDVPPTYAEYDDSVGNVHMNIFRDPDEAYFYVPVGTLSTERREVNEKFIKEFLPKYTVIIINDYHLMELKDDTGPRPHWEYQDGTSFERQEVSGSEFKWRGYNMVSQHYWLSDEEMLDQPEYIECASFSLPKPPIETTG